MPLREALHRRAPAPVRGYARGLSMSIRNNVPAYGFSIVATGGGIAATAELHAPTVLHGFLFLVGATAAFTLVGAVAALAFEEERIEEASPQTVFIGSMFSIFSTCAGFGAAILTAHELRGSVAWFMTAFSGTVAYVFVLALEMELAERLRGRR